MEVRQTQETTAKAAEPRHDGPTEEAHIPAGIGHQLAELSAEAVALVRGEVALARAEVDEKITRVERGIASSVTGAMILSVGMIGLLLAGIFALALLVPLWLSSLILGGAIALIGAVALGIGKRKLSAKRLKPKRLIEEAKATRTFAKEQMG